MIHIVYLTRNTVNDKLYIGMHSSSKLEDGYIGTGVHFKKAVKKYGKEEFRRTILQTFKTRQEALDFEGQIVTQEFVNRSDTYNASLGGGGGTGRTGYKLSEEELKRLSDRMLQEWADGKRKGHPISEQAKQKISKGNMGNTKFLGRKHKESSKQIMSEKMMGKNNPNYGVKQSPEQIERRLAPLRGVPRTKKVKAAISKANTGKGNGLFKGWHVTPWGEYESAALAAKAYDGDISPISVGKWCTVRNATKVRACSASRSTYLTQQDVGKTYAELGFGFREVI